MSTRNRNYFSPDIYIPSLTFHWQLADKTKLVAIALGVFGNRSSVMFDAFADVPDTINRTTGLYKNRQVDIDNFNSRTADLRLLRQYRIGKIQSKQAAGVVYMNNDLHRSQLGRGTTGTDYDLTLVEPGFVRDLHFKTSNVALFAENAFHIGSRLTISPGARFEAGISKMRGLIRHYSPGELPTDIKHRYLLLGLSTEYHLNKENMLYGGFRRLTDLFCLKTLSQRLLTNEWIKTWRMPLAITQKQACEENLIIFNTTLVFSLFFIKTGWVHLYLKTTTSNLTLIERISVTAARMVSKFSFSTSFLFLGTCSQACLLLPLIWTPIILPVRCLWLPQINPL